MFKNKEDADKAVKEAEEFLKNSDIVKSFRQHLEPGLQESGEWYAGGFVVTMENDLEIRIPACEDPSIGLRFVLNKVLTKKLGRAVYCRIIKMTCRVDKKAGINAHVYPIAYRILRYMWKTEIMGMEIDYSPDSDN